MKPIVGQEQRMHLWRAALHDLLVQLVMMRDMLTHRTACILIATIIQKSIYYWIYFVLFTLLTSSKYAEYFSSFKSCLIWSRMLVYKFCIVKQTISKCQMHDIEPIYLWLLKYKSEFFQSVF